MKVRNGFVSNSSSSSFILRFEKNRDMKTQINEMLDKVIDIYDLEEDIEYYGLPEDINEENYETIDEYHEALIKAYKDHVMDDLCKNLETPIDIESVKEDMELAETIEKIDFNNIKQFKNGSLLKYDWISHGYEFKKFLAQDIIDDTDHNYYSIWVSDHFNEDNNFDGNLESWLGYDSKYVVSQNNCH